MVVNALAGLAGITYDALLAPITKVAADTIYYKQTEGTRSSQRSLRRFYRVDAML